MEGYSPLDRGAQVKEIEFVLRLVLVQKRTRLEFLRCEIGRLYTGVRVNTNKG